MGPQLILFVYYPTGQRVGLEDVTAGLVTQLGLMSVSGPRPRSTFATRRLGTV